MKDYCIVRDHTGLLRTQNDQMYESHGDRVGDRDGLSVLNMEHNERES